MVMGRGKRNPPCMRWWGKRKQARKQEIEKSTREKVKLRAIKKKSPNLGEQQEGAEIRGRLETWRVALKKGSMVLWKNKRSIAGQPVRC